MVYNIVFRHGISLFAHACFVEKVGLGTANYRGGAQVKAFQLAVCVLFGLVSAAGHFANKENVGAVYWSGNGEVGGVFFLITNEMAAQRTSLGKRNALLLGVSRGT